MENKKTTTYALKVIRERISVKKDQEETFQDYSDYGDEIGGWQ